MAIEIVESPEPLSEESRRRGSGADPLLVESGATRVVRQELQRYCEGKINGRSFLIAGHRGAGKTTLVAKAFMDVQRLAESGLPMRRPLFIALHGPSLFPDPAAAEAAGAAGAGQKNAGDTKPKPEKSEAQIALEQITLGLHRAVAREFAIRYRERAFALAVLRRSKASARAQLRSLRGRSAGAPGPFETSVLPDQVELEQLLGSLPTDRELFELVGQFEMELYESPPTHRLREFWERSRALSGGVLFRAGFTPLSPTPAMPQIPPGMFPDLIEVHDQGTRELVALAGVLEAYRRISGEYSRSQGEKTARQQTAERTVGLDLAAKELAAPVVSLLTGGAAATALALSGAGPVSTALGGLASALGASLVFKTTTTRKLERATSREYQFIYDLSVSTLDRILPILIGRLHEAGLAPVFVVDELDKVKQLSSRIVTMVHHLKKLVAENAFFCFLTNRSYFEEMLAQGSGRPYPVEYTYYTQRLFVVFSPEDFEQYLRKRIPDEPNPPSATADPRIAVESAGRAILRWALRHRSQLHVVDLQREISALRDDHGLVRTPPELLAASRRNLIDITFQVAIELTLAQPDVAQVLMDRPEFRRLMHDAMYYLSRRWLEGAEEVPLSKQGRQRFLDYLESRTGREEERAAETDHDPVGNEASVSEKDLDFLLDQVNILADFLSDRPSAEAVGSESEKKTRDWRTGRLAEWNDDRKSRGLPGVEPDVLDALLLGERKSLLVRDTKQTGVFRFRHRVAGTARVTTGERPRVVPPAPGPPVQRPDLGEDQLAAPPPEWQEKARFIEAFADMLQRVTIRDANDVKRRESAVTLDALAARFRILAPSPTWSVARAAITRLRDAATRGTPHPGHDDDEFSVEQFHEILTRNGEQIARALVLGAAVGQARGPGVSPDGRIAAGLEVIALAMQFGSKREDDVGKALENVMAMARNELGVDLETPLNGLRNEWPNLQSFQSRTSAALDLVDTSPLIDLETIARRAWNSCHGRLTHWVATNDVLDPEFTELLAAAAPMGPTEFLEFDFRDMTLQRWTRVLVLSRKPGGQGVPETWLSLFAWHALGFRITNDVDASFFRRWATAIGPYDPNASSAGLELHAKTAKLLDGHHLLWGELPGVTLMMLRRGKSSMTAAWRPIPGRALLLASADKLGQILSAATGPTFLPNTNERVCAVELNPELATMLYTRDLPGMDRLLGGAYMVYAYEADRGREMKTPNVVAPQDAQAVIDVAVKARLPVAGLAPIA